MKHEPLEIKTAILKELNSEIISDRNGRRFPHPGLEIQLLAPDEGFRNKLLASFGKNQLQNEIHAYLREPRCLKAAPFVEIGFVEEAENSELAKKGFHLRPVAEAPPSEIEMYLEILDGVANRRQMRLVHKETYIGRCRKVISNQGGTARINDLYFPDVRESKGRIPKNLKEAEKINHSVSRRHAHIKLVGSNYYLFDDGSSKGTSILPDGRGTPETVDKFSGKKLNHNDVVSFGKALIKVRIVKKN